MKPVTQTKLYRPIDHPEGPQHGNCFRAALASVLEIDIEDMPHFEECSPMSEAIRAWMDERGIRFVHHEPHEPPVGYALAYGNSARGIDHAIVVLDGKMIHDPHPNGTGVETIYYFKSIRDMTIVEKKMFEYQHRFQKEKSDA